VVSGVIRGPGLDLRLAEVVAVGPRGDRRSVPVSAGGRFVLPWSGPVEISVHHPHAIAPRAFVLTTRPHDEFTLHLLPRNRARAILVPRVRPAQAGGTEPRVRLLPAAAGRAPVTLDVFLADGGGLMFGGFLPGRYTLVFDLPGLAPLTLRDVVFADGTNDLGGLAVQRGTALRIRILGREGETLPELAITARALQEPRHQRSLRTDGTDAAVLRGLGAGGFQVTAWERHTGLKVWSQRIEADGTNDLRLEIDLR
jgi:hypothetical protein